MKTHTLTTPELVFVIGTRALIAAGIALLVSPKLRTSQRKAVAWALLTIGAVTTPPVVKTLFGEEPLTKRIRALL
jgi:hypothetical protein